MTRARAEQAGTLGGVQNAKRRGRPNNPRAPVRAIRTVAVSLQFTARVGPHDTVEQSQEAALALARAGCAILTPRLPVGCAIMVGARGELPSARTLRILDVHIPEVPYADTSET